MARPAPAFPTLPDYVRAELRSVASAVPMPPKIATRSHEDEDEDDDDRDLAIPAAGSKNAIPRNVFGRAEDEITNDFALPGVERRPRASEPPAEPTAPHPATPPLWQPLSDDEATGEALLSSLRRQENSPDGEPGPSGPGLN
jgi:hypothetical protein